MGMTSNGYVKWWQIIPLLVTLVVGILGLSAYALDAHKENPHIGAAKKERLEKVLVKLEAIHLNRENIATLNVKMANLQKSADKIEKKLDKLLEEKKNSRQ